MVIAQWGILASGLMACVFVYCGRGKMQERLYVSAVQHEITDTLGVGRQVVVEISSFNHGEV